ncbi:MBOAT family O-acyltransferase [Hymenobacter sp. B81]|uniref:MBOAT family O-acyltransferase n=1 Tax=Hymenobacter sp. B81 TaxID=3344878 RepID=UPI0037DC3295
MLFNSYIFLFFYLPILLIVYYGVLKTIKARNAWLTLMSYVFYGWWNPVFCLLMMASTASDYVIGKYLYRTESPAKRKLLMTLTIIVNLSVLGFFKYYNFFAESLNGTFAWLDLPIYAPIITGLILPVGISFYTFESLSYTIDIYRREVKPANNLVDFFCFISLFPHLVAGPIMRYVDLDRQLKQRDHSEGKFAVGIVFLVTGLLKKLIIADNVAPLADAVFNAPAGTTVGDAWLGALAYTMQIYFDFSAYSDMAVGLGLMIGFEIIQNFNSPYQSVSVQDFWRRWHISLSSWLRDYLYVPLGGNRKGKYRTYLNLILVMLLGGLWHGAAWTFVVWGLYHGVLQALERALGERHPLKQLPVWGQRLATFLLVLVGWVFFRAADLPTAFRVLGNLVGYHGGQPVQPLDLAQPLGLAFLTFATIVSMSYPNLWQQPVRLNWRTAVVYGLGLVVSVVLIMTQQNSPFLYFQF